MAVSKVTSTLGRFSSSAQQIAGRIRRLVNDQMEEEMTEVLRLARRMTPLRDGDMTGAIKIQGENRRRKWVVYVDESVPTSDKNGRWTVGAYLTFLHEGSYKLGPLSIVKQAANPDVRVGPQFITRAWEQRYRGMMRRLEAAAKRAGI